MIGEVWGGKKIITNYSPVFTLFPQHRLLAIVKERMPSWRDCWSDPAQPRSVVSGRSKAWDIWGLWQRICTGHFLIEYHHILWYQVPIPGWEISLPGSKPSFTIMLMKVWFILTTLQITFLYCFYFLQGTQNLNRSCQPTICFQWQPRGRNIYNRSSEAQKWHIFHKYSPVIRKKGLNDKKKFFCSEKD